MDYLKSFIIGSSGLITFLHFTPYYLSKEKTEKSKVIFKRYSIFLPFYYGFMSMFALYLGNKFKTKIVVCKTIRFKNSLAYSSRNNLLSRKNIKNGILISNIIKKFYNQIFKDFSKIKEIKNIKHKISSICSRVEYLEIRNKKNLKTNINKNNFKIFVAYYLDNVRLIDNF